MPRFLPDEIIDDLLALATSVDAVEVGTDQSPFEKLSPSGFELLLYSLYRHRLDGTSSYDNVTLMITGADQGRDVWLTRQEVPVGLIQCKREKPGFTAPDTLREVIKFLLFVELDPDLLSDATQFTYHLALSADPAGTTVEFFAAPKKWLAEHEADIAGYIDSVIKSYASFKALDAKMLAPKITEQLNQLSYTLHRPVDLDAMLHDAEPVRNRFFKAKLVVALDEAKTMIEAVIEARFDSLGLRPRRAAATECSQAVEDTARGSRALANWPQDIWGKHIDRPELGQLRQSVANNPSGSTLLIGGAGTGKSALLAELYAALRQDGIPVLAIKADSLAADITDSHDLARDLGMDGTIEGDIKVLVDTGQVVLIIDQLDAVSEVMDQSSVRMQVLLRLAAHLQHARNADGTELPIHVIVSSRPFEAAFDARFKQLDATEVTLTTPSFECVATLLSELDINPNLVPETLKETLRTPFALGLYVDLVKAGISPEDLKPGNLLDRWLDKKLPGGPERRPLLAFLRQLATDMTERETLWCPAAHYEPELNALVRIAEAVGLIVRDGSNIGFSHQSWLDDFQARGFRSAADVAEFAWSRQDGLFARGTILRGLEHLRRHDASTYEKAVELLLHDPRTRRHIRHLVVDFMASVQAPSTHEIAWVDWLVRNDSTLANRAVARISRRWAAWRDGLKPILPFVMQEDQQHHNAVVLLIAEAAEDVDAVFDLINRYWFAVDRDAEVFQVFYRAPVAASRAFERLGTIFNRTSIADFAISQYARALSNGGHTEAAISLVSLWVSHLEHKKAAFAKVRELETIAASAPISFVETLLPWYVATAGQDVENYPSGRARYPRSGALPDDWEIEREQGHVVQALRRALETCARQTPKKLAALVEAYLHVEIEQVQCLIADTFAESPEALANDALSFLLTDYRRLCLGDDTFDDDHGVGHWIKGWSSANLIGLIAPVLDNEQLVALRDYIESWDAFPADSDGESTPDDRRKRRRWSEDERLRLLARLPQHCLAPRRRRQVSEWRGRQPKLEDRPRGLRLLKATGSPMSHQQMGLATDDDIYNMLDEIRDGMDMHDHPRRLMIGGLLELTRAFGEFAKADPIRALRIVRARLQPGRHEEAAGSAIRELATVEAQNPDELKALIWELHRKGFVSESWRQDAASAFKTIAKRIPGLASEDLDLLRTWIVRDAGVLAERAAANKRLNESNRERNEKPDQVPSALLFGRGRGMRIVPHQNYTFLSAIATGLLATENPDCDGWLHELEHHIVEPEDPAIWAFILISNSYHLWWSDAERTSALLASLWRRFPEAFDDAAVVQPLWRLRSRLDHTLQIELIEYWRNHKDHKLRQIAGEFAAACTIVDGVNADMGAVVDSILTGDDVSQKCGVLFSAAAAWREEDRDLRARAHTLLLRSAPSVIGFEAHALSTAVDHDARFVPDDLTRQLLKQVKDNPDLLRASMNMFFVRSLQGLLLYPGFDELVLEIAEHMANLVLASAERNVGNLYDGELVSLAVALQRSRAGLRERAMTLYECLLDAEMYGAEDAATASLRH